jgi:hypothetical protein
MADDLDDFFDDVEQAAAEAVDAEKGEQKDESLSTEPSSAAAGNNKVATVVDADGNTPTDEPAAKRLKTNQGSSSAPQNRPRGVVVAASASSSILAPPKQQQQHHVGNGTTNVGIGLPSMSHSSAIAPMMQSATPAASNGAMMLYHQPYHNNNNQPPLPPGPIPPPPPPPNAPTSGDAAGNTTTSNTKKPIKRMAAGKVWVDSTLDDWPENDFRIFVGNMPRDVTDQQLHDHFAAKYTSLAKAKVVMDAKGISKGYGFCSFLQPLDCAKAIREMDQTWLSSRPIRVKRSDWKDRNMSQVMKQNKKQAKQQKRQGM